jgi:hypothetical protein
VATTYNNNHYIPPSFPTQRKSNMGFGEILKAVVTAPVNFAVNTYTYPVRAVHAVVTGQPENLIRDHPLVRTISNGVDIIRVSIFSRASHVDGHQPFH